MSIDLSSIKELSIGGVALESLSIGGVQIWAKEAQAAYTNQVPLSMDTDGSIFNGCGYQNGYRLSSSGAAKAQDVSTVSGYIPAKAGDVVRIAGVQWGNTSISTNYLCAYDEGFNFIGAVTSSGVVYPTGTTDLIHSALEITGSDAAVTLSQMETIAYIRVSSIGPGTTEAMDGADMIVTINQAIV